MPRFFFNLDNSPDDEGVELESLAIAKCQAIRFAGEVICDASATFWDSAEWALTVQDETGSTLFQLSIVGTEAPSAWLATTSLLSSASAA